VTGTHRPVAPSVARTAIDALVLRADDNVATALRALAAGETVAVRVGGANVQVELQQAIPRCHKFALADLPTGTIVRKYGEAIGVVTRPVAAGAHVHVHNVVSQRGRRIP
jgi:altronate dehydratase small subunit